MTESILPRWMQDGAEFLNTNIWSNKIFHVDMWSILHIVSGGIVFLVLNKWFHKFNKPLIVLGLLVLYEAFEFLLWDYMFRRETFPNILLDIGLGMLGWFILWVVIK